MQVKEDIVSMSAIDPVTNKEMTIAYSTKVQADTLNEIKISNKLRFILIFMLALIIILLTVLLSSDWLSYVGNNLFCR